MRAECVFNDDDCVAHLTNSRRNRGQANILLGIIFQVLLSYTIQPANIVLTPIYILYRVI